MYKITGSRLIVVLVGLVVSACGGGSGSGSSSGGFNSTLLDKYVGAWVGPCVPADGGTELESAVITKSSANTLNAAVINASFSTGNCTGTFSSSSYSYTIQIDGTKTVGANAAGPIVAEKITYIFPSLPAIKDISWILGFDLYTGNFDAGAPFDTEGYPASFEMSPTYSKQR